MRVITEHRHGHALGDTRWIVTALAEVDSTHLCLNPLLASDGSLV